MTDDSKNYKLLAYRAYAVRDILLESMCHKCHLSYIGLRKWSTFPVLFRQKSRWFLQEITATSWGNHGNNCKKSRQLLKEITVISVGSSGFFANYSPAGQMGQMGQMGQRFSETLRVPRVRGTRIIFINYCPICPICTKTSLYEQKKAPEISLQGSRLEKWRPPTLPHCIAVPSAQAGLTSLFGMGRGGTPPQ